MMSKDNGLVLLEGWQKIEADGLLTVGFSVSLDKTLENADPKTVGEEIFRQLLDGDLVEIGPAISYRITGP